MLSAPPSKSEIMKKLKKAKNTSPGKDKIEYLHLKLLDKKCLLLEKIFKAVHIIVIPACWKISKTIHINKKGRTDLPSNIRPIGLLPTMYNIYSGILSNRIIKVAVSK